jgi:regulator of cell morphogenesis and NO signaling
MPHERRERGISQKRIEGDEQMTTLNPEATVGELVAEKPARSRLFEELGIDYCCGGRKPLDQACRDEGLDPEQVVRRIEEADRQAAAPERDWTRASMSELADHIEQTHHAYLRKELPRLSELTSKARQVHGENHPELIEVERVFLGLRGELESHMMKEEQILFPIIRQLEQSDAAPTFHCGSVNNPIGVMEDEHDNAGRALSRLRELTGDYAVPEDACGTYRAMLDALEHLEWDLHLHIHKENNILFPRASRREAELAGSPG